MLIISKMNREIKRSNKRKRLSSIYKAILSNPNK